jgi:ADP-heptose:LPS heptosyltransferase
LSFNPRNILVIDFGQLGDVVMSLPALRAIRERFSDAQISVLVGKPAAEIIGMSGYANITIPVDRVALRDGSKIVSIARIIKLVSQVRKTKYDFVIDLNSLSETNLLGFLSGAQHRLFSHRPGRSIDYLANFKPRPPREVKESHLVDRYLDVLKPLDIVNASRIPYLKTNPIADQVVESLLKKEKAQSNNLLVGVFPGSSQPDNRWPIERFAELSDYLVRNDRVRVIVFGGPEERELIRQHKQLFPSTTVVFDQLTIPQLASALARLTLLVSNDTGPMHIAAAVGTTVIDLLNRPTPNTYVPVGDKHRIMCAPTVRDLTVEQVYRAVHETLADNRTEQIFSRSDQR